MSAHQFSEEVENIGNRKIYKITPLTFSFSLLNLSFLTILSKPTTSIYDKQLLKLKFALLLLDKVYQPATSIEISSFRQRCFKAPFCIISASLGPLTHPPDGITSCHPLPHPMKRLCWRFFSRA